jgi:DNA-directed RNA polymerase subunit M/transcription elongation factor TFIIS
MEDVALQLGIDVERRTTRGRVCPRCGGKIIPSRRAVYQSGDPNEVFPAWQCEKCGYEELVSRPVKAAPKHGAKPAEKKPATAAASSGPAIPGVTTSQKAPAMRATPSMKDRKGRELPADVVRMLTEMNKTEGSKQ